ncbi:hypothetical protein, partial [Escherichia coli]
MSISPLRARQPVRHPVAVASSLLVLLLSACGGSGGTSDNFEKGRWTTGDLHTHTVQSDDSRTTQTLDFLLGKAFTTYG